GDRPHLLARRQEGVAEAQAAVSGDQGRLRRAHDREQRGDDRPRAAHHQPGRRVVRVAWHQDPGRHADVLGLRARDTAGRLRGLGGDHAAPDHRGPRGGVTGNGRLKAVVPGGSSAAILRADEIDVTADVDGLRNAGTMAGSAGVIVMDETVSIPEALMVVARFYAHESCGQCTPCRESTGWIYKMVRRIVEGRGQKDDLDTILDVARRGAGTTICAFYDGAVGPYISYIEKFRAEFEALIPK